MMTRFSTHILLILVIIQIGPSYQHGRLIDPVSRQTAWRYGFDTPKNYNDHEMFCGGMTHQYGMNGGKCGVCGDPFDLPLPRPYEFGGEMCDGIIVRKYDPGELITIKIDLVSYHFGYFEFKLCDSTNDSQECFDRNVLKIASGRPWNAIKSDTEFRYYPRNGVRIYELDLQLPKGVECDHCVLLWRYRAATNWGLCEDGKGVVGCGPQEEFRACSDITIKKGGDQPYRPTFINWSTGEASEIENDISHHDHYEAKTAKDVKKPTAYDWKAKEISKQTNDFRSRIRQRFSKYQEKAFASDFSQNSTVSTTLTPSSTEDFVDSPTELSTTEISKKNRRQRVVKKKVLKPFEEDLIIPTESPKPKSTSRSPRPKPFKVQKKVDKQFVN